VGTAATVVVASEIEKLVRRASPDSMEVQP
jgi:hypothetical protein